MFYKYELHCHTDDVSVCANVPTPIMVEEHIKAGYDGLVLTNHINSLTFASKKFNSWHEKMDYFLNPYHVAKELTKDRIKIFLGMELTLQEAYNDFLIYGFEEDFLYRHENLDTLSIRELSALVRENDLLLIQAHPFRNHMTITPPALLDGIEVCNANPRHDSRNDIARLWANRHNLIATSGSDYHELIDVGRGGVLFSSPVHTNKELVCALRGDKILLEPDKTLPQG